MQSNVFFVFFLCISGVNIFCQVSSDLLEYSTIYLYQIVKLEAP